MPKSLKKLSQKSKIIILIVAFLAIVAGGFFFICAVAGWFDQPQTITLDLEYQGTSESYVIDAETYEQMVSEQKSFILIAYLPTCTADIIKYMQDYSMQHNIAYFYLNWSNLRETSLKDVVDFSPSVILVSNGQPIAHLRADSNDDIEKYNNQDAFNAWLDSYITF